MTQHFCYIFLLFFILTSCVMPEEYLMQTELQETESYHIIYKGNTVWMEPKDSLDLENVYRIVYKMKKIKGGYAPTKIMTYDSTLNLVKSEQNAAIEIYKFSFFSGKCVKIKFLDHNKELFEPKYLDYAIEKLKYVNDSCWISKYYDKNNQPSCGSNGFIVYTRVEPVQMDWIDSVSIGSNFVTVYKIDCKGDTINF